MKTIEKDTAKSQALAQLESIRELVELLDDDNTNVQDKAQEDIQDDPLSIEIRSSWETDPSNMEPTEFKILLCTGGPACQIRGELDEYKQPYRAWVEYQDWGTRWTMLIMNKAENDDLLTYCQQFYFGE